MSKKARCICITVVLLLITFSVSAEQYAYLEDGPDIGKGLPFLPPNATEYRLGFYRLHESLVEVYFVSLETWPGDDWTPYGEENRFIHFDSGMTVVRADGFSFRIYAIFQGEDQPDAAIEFIDAFANRLSYFMSRGNTLETVPFPAILTRP